MAKRGNPGIKASSIEKEKRVRAVQEWILQGYATSDIIRQLEMTCGIKRRAAYHYYRDAFELWKEENRISMEHKVAYHLSYRRKLLKDLKEKDTPLGAKAALAIADSSARIEGVLKKHDLPYSVSEDDDEKLPTMILPTEKETKIEL